MISTSRTSAFQISGSVISSHKNIQEALWSERDGRADRKMTTSDGYCHLCQEYRKDHQPAKALWPDHSAERGQLLLRIYSPENHGVYPEPLREKTGDLSENGQPVPDRGYGRYCRAYAWWGRQLLHHGILWRQGRREISGCTLCPLWTFQKAGQYKNAQKS